MFLEFFKNQSLKVPNIKTPTQKMGVFQCPCIYWVWRVFYIHLAAKVRRIQPLYVTYEYITRSREELGKYLDQGKILLMDCQKNKNVL